MSVDIDSLVEQYRPHPVPWGYGALSEVVYRRTYSRDGEQWADTCGRVMKGLILEHDRFGVELDDDFYTQMYDDLWNLRWSPPGRGLWMMGTPFVHERRVVEALQNCAFTSTENPTGDTFRWFMEMLMLGVGVGFDTKGAGTPVLEPKGTYAFSIDDDREGWAISVARLVDAYFQGTARPDFYYGRIRPAGESINGFGGVASGAAPLIQLHQGITDLLDRRNGSVLSSRDITDICNLIGVCVVAGNVRRSAEIAIGDADDEEFIYLKDYSRYPERAEFGWTSNNSIRLTGKGDSDRRLDGFASLSYENGEPGYIFFDNVTRFGRIGEQRPDNAVGANPCLTGDTLVWTINGAKRIDSLVGTTPRVLTETDSGQMVFRTMKDIRKTRENAEVFKVTLRPTKGGKPTGETSSFRVTGDHIIFMSDRSERFAKDLKPGDRLASVYRRKANSKGYLQLRNGRDVDMEHRIVEADQYGDVRADYPNEHVDHIDENKRNNVPSNLRRLSHETHNALNMRGSYNPVNRGYNANVRDDVITSGVQALRDTGMTYREIADTLECSVSTVRRRLEVVNHVVESVEFVGYEDVYDGEVEDTHKFFIVTEQGVNGEDTGGVLVHNCVEQFLAHREMCTLAEVYAPRCDSHEILERQIKNAYIYAKTVTMMSADIRDETSRDIMQANRRMGVSLTGVAQFIDKYGYEALITSADTGYRQIQILDRTFSAAHGIPESIRLTTVKPGGTVCLLAGVTPGVHFAPTSRLHIRRVTMASNSPLVIPLIEAGYKVEPSVTDKTAVVVEFPIDAQAKGEDEAELEEQVYIAEVMQQYWSDNGVSFTAKFDRSKVTVEQLADTIKAAAKTHKAISFLPLEDHGYAQAPYEKIDEETFKRLSSNLKPLVLDGNIDAVDQADLYCDGELCTIPNGEA